MSYDRNYFITISEEFIHTTEKNSFYSGSEHLQSTSFSNIISKNAPDYLCIYSNFTVFSSDSGPAPGLFFSHYQLVHEGLHRCLNLNTSRSIFKSIL